MFLTKKHWPRRPGGAHSSSFELRLLGLAPSTISAWMLLNNARVLERLVTLALHGDVRLRELSPLRGRKNVSLSRILSKSGSSWFEHLALGGRYKYVDASHGGAEGVSLENFSFTGNYNF